MTCFGLGICSTTIDSCPLRPFPILLPGKLQRLSAFAYVVGVARDRERNDHAHQTRQDQCHLSRSMTKRTAQRRRARQIRAALWRLPWTGLVMSETRLPRPVDAEHAHDESGVLAGNLLGDELHRCESGSARNVVRVECSPVTVPTMDWPYWSYLAW